MRCCHKQSTCRLPSQGTLQIFLNILRAQFAEAPEIPLALHESYAWQLLMRATGLQREQLLVCSGLLLTDEQREWLQEALIAVTIRHQPIQYIIGTVPFLNLSVQVRPPILIPRPETEAWVAELLNYYQERRRVPHRVLDIGTGTGCIALALADAYRAQGIEVIGIDCNPTAIELAEQNARAHGLTHCTFLLGDLYAPVAASAHRDRFDCIVANPPYIPQKDRDLLDLSVRMWESEAALFAGADGLDLIRSIIAEAPQYAKTDSLASPLELWIEIDRSQELAVRALFQEAGFIGITTWRDAAGYSRMVHGRWQQSRTL